MPDPDVLVNVGSQGQDSAGRPRRAGRCGEQETVSGTIGGVRDVERGDAKMRPEVMLVEGKAMTRKVEQ